MSADLQTLHPDDVETLVGLARRVIPRTWGLDTFVAVNPLAGFEQLPFEAAAARAADLLGARCHPTREEIAERISSGQVTVAHLRRAVADATVEGLGPPQVDDIVAWLDAPDVDADAGRPDGAAAIMCGHGVGRVAAAVDVFAAHWYGTYLGGGAGGAMWDRWLALAPHDPDLRRRATEPPARFLDGLPSHPSEAVAALLARRRVPAGDALRYLEAQIARLPGWVATFALRAETGHRGELVEMVAVRLALEAILAGPADPANPPGSVPSAGKGTVAREAGAGGPGRGLLWQRAAEIAYRDELLGRLVHRDPVGREDPGSRTGADAQIAFCIDVRSEGMRRNLEALGPWSTIGFAGFFGVPVAVREKGSDRAVPHCPVLVDVRATVEIPPGGATGPRDRDVVCRGFAAAKSTATGGYVLADASGWLLGPRSLVTSLAPALSAKVVRGVRRLTGGDAPAAVSLDPTPSDPTVGFSVDDRVRVAHGALTAMGLTQDLAPLVVFCGHRSDNRNNPYRSSLHCGACGGNPGGVNARLLAAMCNDPTVRVRLAAVGIEIDDRTWFLAAEHETTDDDVSLFDTADAPAHLRETVERLAADLGRAGDANRAQRWQRLPASPTAGRSLRRRSDPAQVVPDWGLVRNAAIVVGPRALTAGHDLDRRVFLHDYDAASDPDGTVLEAIMTGPVVVAHWISAQYYFSAIDPLRFGAGSKPFHNVVGRVGVTEGVGADVRVGLPLESVRFGGRLVHDPLRLLVVVDASAARVGDVIARNPVLRQLADGGWIDVVARPSNGDGFALRGRDARWERWTAHGPGGEPAEVPARTVRVTHGTASREEGV